MRLCLFDFDGTISCRDTFLLFLREVVGPARFSSKCVLLAPHIFLFCIGRLSNHDLKERFLQKFLAGKDYTALSRLAENLTQTKLHSIIRMPALDQLQWHRQNNDEIVIVSASLDLILAPWCKKNGYKLLATRPESIKGKLTGRICGNNCRGQEKIHRVHKHFALDSYDEIWAYGDSPGDYAMLKIADVAFYKPFRRNWRAIHTNTRQPAKGRL